jgi:EmrB/QacA subfamily drug resistance transporter
LSRPEHATEFQGVSMEINAVTNGDQQHFRTIAAPATSPNQGLAIVSVGIILAQLDLFIVNVGLPDIARDLQDSNLEKLSWILNGYAIAYAALLVFCGRLAERYPRHLTFLAGIGAFTAASAACAAADSVDMLIMCRVVQAAGAALMTPTSLGLLLAAFAPEKRAAAVRTWTAIGGFAAALGPLVGGVLVTASWRWIFLVNVPLGVAALCVGWQRLPHFAGHDAPRPSVWAAVLVTTGVASLTFAIVEGNSWGWMSVAFASSMLIAGVCIALFISQCLRSDNPFIDPTLFRSPGFTESALALTLFCVSFGAMLLSIVLWYQSVWHRSALQIGVLIAPGPLLVPITSLLFAKQLIARFGSSMVILAGVVLFSCGLAIWASLLTVEPRILPAVFGQILIGVGTGLVMPTLMGVAVSSLPKSSFATGSGVVNMLRQTSFAIGVAVLVAILGHSSTIVEKADGLRHGWWTMTAICLCSLVPICAMGGDRREIAAATSCES